VSGPAATWRRSGLSGNEAISSAGSPSGSSDGVGACTTGDTLPGSRAGVAPSPEAGTVSKGTVPTATASMGTAQRTDQAGCARSSTGRSASSAGSSGPPSATTCHVLTVTSDALVVVMVIASAPCVAVRIRMPSPASMVTSASAGSASSSAGPVRRFNACSIVSSC